MAQQTRTRCIYRVLDNGVHEFVMTETSRGAVDDFISAMEEMASVGSTGKPAPTLFDTQVGIQPINYIFTRIRTLMQKFPASQERGKLAMIMKPNVLLNTIEALMRVFPNLKVRFFKPEERDAAIQWLITD